MEIQNPLLIHHNLIDFPLNPHKLPSATSISHSEEDYIEMIAFQNMSYTSLKDLLPSSPSPPVASPTNSSWREIPIKDPLVQHAAWAYLQPMASEACGEDDTWWRRFEKKCCGLLSCFNDVVLAVFGWSAEERGGGDDKLD